MTYVRSWGIIFGNVDSRKVKLAHVHAAVSRVLDTKHWSNNKPWSIGMVKNEGSGVASLRISTVGDAPADAVVATFYPGQQLRFGAQEAMVLFPPRLEAEIDESGLCAIPAWVTVGVRFCTPTTFRVGSKTTPLPDPTRVFHSLSSRWEKTFGHRLVDDREEERRDILPAAWVRDINGRNKVFNLGGKLTVSGFVGEMSYEFGSEKASQVFCSLLGLAGFIGLGSYTTRGLGSIELLD